MKDDPEQWFAQNSGLQSSLWSEDWAVLSSSAKVSTCFTVLCKGNYLWFYQCFLFQLRDPDFVWH